MSRWDECPFCDFDGPVIADSGDVYVIEPLNPVVPGHELVIPKKHVTDAASFPELTARVMQVAAARARAMGDFNIITSRGRWATQTVFHLHVHLVPRRKGDGLLLPWTKNARERSGHPE